jgi:hypothetical protein
MTFKGVLATAVVLLAIWLMFGQHASATPAHRPVTHSTAHHAAPRVRGARSTQQ